MPVQPPCPLWFGSDLSLIHRHRVARSLDPRTFLADAAFAAQDEINWSETPSARIAVGDVVYLYGTLPLQALTHRCLVTRTDVQFEQRIDDARFWADTELLRERRNRTWMRLRLLQTFDNRERARLSVRSLKDRGLKRAPQGRMRVPGSLGPLLDHLPGGRVAPLDS